MLAPVTGWEFVSLKECGTYPEPVEDADDFEGNARIKALAARDNTGLPASPMIVGLVVDALDGAPACTRAALRAKDATDAQNNAKLLDLMADVPDDERTARLSARSCSSIRTVRKSSPTAAARARSATRRVATMALATTRSSTRMPLTANSTTAEVPSENQRRRHLPSRRGPSRLHPRVREA